MANEKRIPGLDDPDSIEAREMTNSQIGNGGGI
jgi:hypothetical protein